MPLSLIRQDITLLHVDAIVNAANQGLRPGGGVCGAIFAAAGYDDLCRACEKIGHVDTGAAVATPGFALPARHIIHTAGPIWHGGTAGERDLLASCYRSSLELAAELGDRSIAFPLISSGIYGYPPAEALAVALGEIRAFLAFHPDMEVTLCLFDRSVTTLTKGIFGEIAQFIDDTYVEESPFARRERWEEAELANSYPSFGASAAPAPLEDHKESLWPFRRRRKKREEAEPSFVDADAMPHFAPPAAAPQAAAPKPQATLEDLLDQLDEPFSQMLLAMIDERGMTDAQVYSRANLSRQYFSKLRSGKVNPSKRVVLSLAVALGLSYDETRALLERAGHALTHASKFDIIVEWFIRNGHYDIFEINQVLFSFDQPLLGAS